MDAFVEGVGMNSRNHHMWSSYSHYLVSGLAGISQDIEPAAGGQGGGGEWNGRVIDLIEARWSA
jgi:hypothetical protein